MDEKSTLYELEFPAPQLADDEGDGPVLIHALEGFADAGHAIKLASDHLRQSLDSELVATFSTDELIDYRSRRPLMSFTGDEFTAAAMPELTLHAIRDNNGTPFLLLSGAEPDLRWERFVAAIGALSDQFGVTSVIGLNAIPMGIPHTRPSTITAHGNSKDLIGSLPRWGSELKVPGSASMLLELRLGERGLATAGLSVHVPHYLSQAEYPAASHKLLESLGEVTGLDLPTAALANAAEKVRTQVDAEVSGNQEVESVVAALETQYDTFNQAQQEKASLLAAEGDLPTGDELGAELERFLADHAQNEAATENDAESRDGDDKGDGAAG
ncbi:proteasome assembly chaperone (PAC2) family protein [Williamsia limnetica]|uniref:Proteasome assembly chaperone (PAC2) family protein n=1 Tax=Williamsia limnetica TaxID=882452 RepID=A0A318RTY4_WILLI|nr:PAC2 family protein [Williamsia limnetica]PYE21151.1 proteasome assembly chaperone (PAC2) family protein [Williamsia limnetica]